MRKTEQRQKKFQFDRVRLAKDFRPYFEVAQVSLEDQSFLEITKEIETYPGVGMPAVYAQTDDGKFDTYLRVGYQITEDAPSMICKVIDYGTVRAVAQRRVRKST